MNAVPRIIIPMLKVNHIFLVPWIVLSLPTAALFKQQILITSILTILGLAGMLTRSLASATFASASLLALTIWGKIASDVFGLEGTDTALLLLRFMVVIFLMEASTTAVTLDAAYRQLNSDSDEISMEIRTRVTEWARVQLLSLGRLTLAAFGLSLGLLVIGGIVSVSVNQLAFSGILVIVAVIALVVLLTYRREPEDREELRS